MSTASNQQGAPNFDRVAHLYRWAEYLLMGPHLQRTRTSLLSHLCQARRALILGDGDGRFLATLLQASPQLRALAVDRSASMLHLLRARCSFAAGRLQTLQGDVRDLPASLTKEPVDLVVTHFLLDCLTQPEMDRLAAQLAGRLEPGGRWLLSDFAFPPRPPWRWLGTWYIRALYAAFGLLTGLRVRSLPKIAPALLKAGFHPLYRTTRCKGLLFSELWELPSPGQSDAARAT